MNAELSLALLDGYLYVLWSNLFFIATAAVIMFGILGHGEQRVEGNTQCYLNKMGIDGLSGRRFVYCFFGSAILVTLIT